MEPSRQSRVLAARGGRERPADPPRARRARRGARDGARRDRRPEDGRHRGMHERRRPRLRRRRDRRRSRSTRGREDGCLVVRVRDYGAGIRPLADVEHRSLRLGLPLIAALTRSFEVSGAPGHGTEVRMMDPARPELERRRRPRPRRRSTRRGSRCRPPASCSAPILSRVISMFATRADFSVDELSDAVLLSDAISASGRASFPDGTARLAVSEQQGSFEVRVGPLEPGGGAAAARRDAHPELRRLAGEPRRRGQGRRRGRRRAARDPDRRRRADQASSSSTSAASRSLRERAAEDARDVHLRVADLLGDLRLRQVLGEAQP